MNSKKCNKNQRKKKIHKYCPMTCGKCGTEEEEEEDDGSCKDDPLFRFRKNNKNWTCDMMNSKKCKKKQGGKKIHKYCPMTCGKCGTKN